MKKSLFLTFLLLCGIATFAHAGKKGMSRSASFSGGDFREGRGRSRISSVPSIDELVNNNYVNRISRSTSMGKMPSDEYLAKHKGDLEEFIKYERMTIKYQNDADEARRDHSACMDW